MNRKSISAFVVAAIILLPIVFLPFSGDQSIFALGGKMLFEGKLLYHDYVDLKPPMVFIFYGFISLFAGTSEIGFRIFEFIWQLSTIFILFKVVENYFSLNAAQAAVIIFSAVYTSMNFSQTLQPESFMNMIAILLIWLQLRGKNNIFSALAKGALIGFATSFKFTFGIFLIIILIDDLFNSDSKLQFIKNSIVTILAMALTFALSFIPLMSSHSYEGFKNVIQYLNFYSAYPPVNLALFKEPSSEITSEPNSSSIELKAGFPISTTTLEAISASTTFTPSSSNLSDATVLPLPIPPVNPTTNIDIILTKSYFPNCSLLKKKLLILQKYHFYRQQPYELLLLFL